MIVFVKINLVHVPGNNPKVAAYRAWRLNRLINPNEADFRNSMKYLVAVYNMQVIASYCIHGVAPDTTGPTVKVKFSLADCSAACHKSLVQAYNTVAANRNLNPLTAGYISEAELNALNPALMVNINRHCKCVRKNIPLMNEPKIGEPQKN
ncbi:MAG TPA: hypothetical protein EYN51_10350 [Flavobacteriales bacterium]|nr:hypothetical protein [Flavobacteriales bacterium]